MERNRILVFDVGTSAVKTALFDAALRPVALTVTEYPIQTAGARVEAEPDAYLSAMRTGVAALPDTSHIAAIGMTTQGETLLPVDADGAPLANAIVWLDARAETEAAFLADAIPVQDFYEKTGLPEIGGALPLSKLLWLRRQAPAVFGRARYFLLLEDYLRLRLTGVCASHASLLTSTGYWDIRANGYWTEALALAGVPTDRLPPVLPSGAHCGTLMREAAETLGLTTGIPVFTGAMDQTAALLAASAGRENMICETTGTAHVVAAATAEPRFDAAHRVTVYRHALDGRYLYLPIGNTAGMAYKWFRREFGREGEDYAALDRLAAGVPAGCEGVIFLPFLCGAVDPVSLPEATGCLFGLRLSSTRAHAARAVLEATGYELRQFLELVDGGQRMSRIAAIGGGASSPLWMQIRADISGRVLSVPMLTEAAATGAALLAGWGAGLIEKGAYPSVLTEYRRTYMPDPAARNAYDVAFTRYTALFAALMPLYGGAAAKEKEVFSP